MNMVAQGCPRLTVSPRWSLAAVVRMLSSSTISPHDWEVPPGVMRGPAFRGR